MPQIHWSVGYRFRAGYNLRMVWRSFFAGLFGRPGDARHVYVPSTIRFMEIDAEQVKKKLDLETQGRLRGEKEKPEPGNESLDDVEQRSSRLSMPRTSSATKG